MAGGKAALLMASVFGSTPVIKGFEERFGSEMVWTNQLAGEKSIGSGFGGAMGQKGSDEHREQVEEENQEGWEHVSSHLQQAREQERERSENYSKWLDEEHDYAGQKMDGKDWENLIKWLDDPANEEEWEDAMMAKTGQSRAEVKETRGKMRRYTSLMQKIADGTATAEEKAEFDKLGKDKDIRTGIEVAKERADHLTSESENALNAQSEVDKEQNRSATTSLVVAKADLDAEPITPKYNAASSGAPVPDTKLQFAAAQPVKAPVAGLSADLDMG